MKMNLSFINPLTIRKAVTGFSFFFCLISLCCILAGDASAGALGGPGGPVPPAPDGTCTTDPQFNPAPPAPGDGILSRITENVRTVLNGLTAGAYQNLVSNGGFRDLVSAMLTLYVAVYGILFTFAMVQTTLFDFATRMIKFGIIVLLISGSSWSFFSNTVVTFFNDGTDSLIAELTQITVGGISQPINPGDPPFVVIDQVIQQALSAKMAVTLLAAFFTGPYGLLFGLLILMSLSIFVRAVLVAVWVYLMSLVVKTLLFIMAPLFISCLLFNRTRHLFQGWLNQVLNASLQPILLFAFFAFFAKLIEAAIDNILQVPVCWTETMESLRGTPFYMHYWRFTLEGDPYGGLWSWVGAQTSSPSPTFPINIMDVLIFLIIAELASRFNSVVLMIARDLASATTSLATMQGDFKNLMGPGGRKGAAPGAGDNVAAPVPGRAGGNRADGISGVASGGGGGAAASNTASASQQAFPPGGNRIG